ncbi:hypothetical protein LIA77_07425 [Sarocladium implicatum]|nr:hypothetical protein LIA77_07425 [Sarocladium implicatum]
MAVPGLPPRYEIRVVPEEHQEWISALMCYGFVHRTKLWMALVPDDEKVPLTLRAYVGVKDLALHMIRSGKTIAVYDKEYVYKRPESAASGGKLWWDVNDKAATRAQLLEQMDFPLVHLAAAFDQFDKPSPEVQSAASGSLPPMAHAFRALASKDPRPPEEATASGFQQTLSRVATVTQEGYEGQKLMKLTAHYMMRKTAEEGFRGMQIQAFADAVAHVWSNPPEPFKVRKICELDYYNYEETNEDGETTFPFRPADFTATKLFIDLV